jgi:flavin reductase
VLTDALAWLECELAETYGGGDHSIFLGAVLSAVRREHGTTSGSEALLFYGGGFHRFGRSA